MQNPSLFQQINPINLQFPEHEQLKCPRCDSDNTKFCYYNNYNLSQPRYYCKNCRRYWTKGGTLRNIPVGGGSRKPTKRSSSTTKRSSSSPSSTSTPKSEPLVGNQTVEQESRTHISVSDQFRSLIEGLNSNGVTKDPTLSLNSGADQNLEENPVMGSKSGERYLGVNGNGGDSSYWGSGNGWPDLSIYNQGPGFQ